MACGDADMTKADQECELAENTRAVTFRRNRFAAWVRLLTVGDFC